MLGHTSLVGRIALNQWRKLFVVSNQNKRIGSDQRSQDRGLTDLTCLINDHHVEVLTHEERALRDCQGADANYLRTRNHPMQGLGRRLIGFVVDINVGFTWPDGSLAVVLRGFGSIYLTGEMRGHDAMDTGMTRALLSYANQI